MGGLALSGLGIGVWDVGMNLEGAGVERLLGRSIMPRFHAAWSAGTVLSALAGSALSAWRVPVLTHLLVTGALVTALGLVAVRSFLPRATEGEGAAATTPAFDPALRHAGRGGTASAWFEPRTLLVGVVTFVAAFTEGTANDWLSVAMVEGHGLPVWAGVLGFATFLSAMTLGRVVGTRWLDRYGRVAVLRVLFLLALCGAALVVFGGPRLAFVGAALWGVGASLGFPVGMSAAADDPARAAPRVSVVATIGYVAFLAGPPLLGLLGDRVGVLRALLVVGVLVLAALLAVPAVRPPGTRSG
jgi:fucose permease